MKLSLIQQCQDENMYQESVKMNFNDLKIKTETMAKEAHNIKLIDLKNKNNNIYILWNDGRITSETIEINSISTIEQSIFPLFLKLHFPYSRDGYTGIILTLEECRIFRLWIYGVFRITKK